MTLQTRATLWSFALHLLIGLSIVGAGSWTPPDLPEPTVIDLDIAVLPPPVELGSPAPLLGPPPGPAAPPPSEVSAVQTASKAPPRRASAEARVEKSDPDPDPQPSLPMPVSEEVVDNEDVERSAEEEILEPSDLGAPVEPALPAASEPAGLDTDAAGETGSGGGGPDGVPGGVVGGGLAGGVPGGVRDGVPDGIPGGMGKGDDMGRFSALVWSKIERARFYPRSARRQGWEGVIGIRFLILPDGKVSEITLIQPSPHDTLNEAAKETVSRAAPFRPRPKGLEGEVFVMQVAIAFKLE
ncbi:MAG: energy transducer TonB [Candidatus Manganitrophaceae bacterium]